MSAEQQSSIVTRHSSILVIQTAFLGDAILTTPLLAALAERHGPVDVVVTPAAAPLLVAHPVIREVIPFDKRGRDRSFRGLWRLGTRLRERRYVRVYLPHRSLRSAILAWLTGAPERIGFADSVAAWSYTRRVARPKAGHEVERLLALVESRKDGKTEGREGAEAAAAPPVQLGLTVDDRRQAAAWLAEQGIADGFIALAPGSVWATKRWPYYRELAERLDRPVVVVGGPEDADTGREIGAGEPSRIRSAAGELPLAVSAALLAHAAVVVTNDSAPLHLGAAAGVPVVAIFGPTVPAFGFGPRGHRDQIVELGGLACRPCSTHGPMRCPLGHHRCMRELGVERVLEAVQRAVVSR